MRKAQKHKTMRQGRQSQLDGRLRLRHLQEHTEAVAEEMEHERQRFERLKDPGSAPRVVSAFNLFQTPVHVAAQLVELAGNGARWLEPSAGLGRIYRAIRDEHSEPITLVEQSAECCGELYRETTNDSAATLIQADFLECDAERLGGLFDCIAMNPPFKMGRDIKHIEHARTLLAPGGVLVSLCANGPRQRDNLMGQADDWIELPAETFRREATKVRAAVCVFRNGLTP